MENAFHYFDDVVQFLYNPVPAVQEHLKNKVYQVSWRLFVFWFRLTALFVSLSCMVLSACIIHLFLYWLFIPDVLLSRPVFFDFSSSKQPTAHVNLINKQWRFTNVTEHHYPSALKLFDKNEEYQIILDLIVPDSPHNRRSGMLMASIDVMSCDKKLLASSTRPILIPYRSWIVRYFYETILAVPLAFGIMKEEHKLSLDLIDGFVEDEAHPACGAVIQLSQKSFEVYKSNVRFEAQLHGVRYFLYYWFTVSSLFSVCLITFFEVVSLATLLAIHYWKKYKQAQDEEDELEDEDQDQEQNQDQDQDQDQDHDQDRDQDPDDQDGGSEAGESDPDGGDAVEDETSPSDDEEETDDEEDLLQQLDETDERENQNENEEKRSQHFNLRLYSHDSHSPSHSHVAVESRFEPDKELSSNRAIHSEINSISVTNTGDETSGTEDTNIAEKTSPRDFSDPHEAHEPDDDDVPRSLLKEKSTDTGLRDPL